MTALLDHQADLTIRDASLSDASCCGEIFFSAFEAIARQHNFPVEPGSPEFTNYKVGELLESPGVVGLVAEREGKVVGCAFVDERGAIAGIGPVTVDPACQDRGVGTALMQSLLRRERDRSAAGVRLVQSAYHSRSLALYASLGFTVREPLSVLQGVITDGRGDGPEVRPARSTDIEECSTLCTTVHGHDRTTELEAAVAAGTAMVAVRRARIVGYATGFGYGWHAVADDNDAVIALLKSAGAFMGLGILVPSRNGELLSWCLRNGLRLVQQSTLMSIGLYNEPAGAWLPSIVY
jgi:predicted N-acetyltransferase YhbS